MLCYDWLNRYYILIYFLIIFETYEYVCVWVWTPGFTPGFWCGPCCSYLFFIFWVVCCFFFVFFRGGIFFFFCLRSVSNMPVFLDCPFLIDPSVVCDACLIYILVNFIIIWKQICINLCYETTVNNIFGHWSRWKSR